MSFADFDAGRLTRRKENEHMSVGFNCDFTIRRAAGEDASYIHSLLEAYASKGLLLPLSIEKIEETADAFLVACRGASIIGCVALRDFGDDLYEVRSLAVESSMNGMGIGSRLVLSLVEDFSLPDDSRLFALTYRPNFFMRLGFELVDKGLFPQKIWSDCEKCPKKEHCDEQAVRAVLPLPKQSSTQDCSGKPVE
jgi:amino-acid N-acetyltransferase